MRRAVWVGMVGWLLATTALNGEDAELTVASVLAQLHVYGRQYLAKLPSLSCDESITSEKTKKNEVKQTVLVEATLREVRKGGGDDFTETHAFHTIDGRPVHGSFRLPLFVQGAFANAVGFSNDETSRCFDYSLSSEDGGKVLKFDQTIRATKVDAACAGIPDGYRKTVWIEKTSGRVVRVERSISAGAAKKGEVYFASMTYGPQKMGDEILWLPTEMSAHDPKDEGRMTVKYSNYHRYTATSTIVQNP